MKKMKLKKKKRNKGYGIRKMIRLLRSFKIRQFYLNIDTGDVIKNAKLYPVFAFLNYSIGGFQINFMGKNQVVIRIENRPIRIIKSFFNI